jgi:DNA replication protein DnaC
METTTRQQNDPVKLQRLLNSLTAYNNQWKSDKERWKVRDEVNENYRNPDGTPMVTKYRVAYVAPVLEAQYKILVEQRAMQLRPIDQRILNYCIRFLTDPTTRTSLLLYGTPGTGKTTFMKAMWMTVGFIYQEEISRKNIVNRYIKASELGALLKQDKDAYKAVKSATCLFIDDLGFTGESEVVNDYGVKARPIEDIIEHRYDRQLLTVCTTNLTEGEIREKYGDRIHSRLCEQFAMLSVAGADYRQMTR